jgi:hypothetical protein
MGHAPALSLQECGKVNCQPAPALGFPNTRILEALRSFGEPCRKRTGNGSLSELSPVRAMLVDLEFSGEPVFQFVPRLEGALFGSKVSGSCDQLAPLRACRPARLAKPQRIKSGCFLP